MNNEEYKYKLYAVLIHDGYSINSGHYYSFVRLSHDNWYAMNDSSVSKINERTVLQQAPYMLFYEKVQKYVHRESKKEEKIEIKKEKEEKNEIKEILEKE